jgi:hypothetical protein
MNAIAAHKDELKKNARAFEQQSGLGMTFVALVDAYITRLDANCSDISTRVDPPPAQINVKLTYGTNIDSKLRALLCAT